MASLYILHVTHECINILVCTYIHVCIIILQFAEFDQIMKSDPENLASLINRVQHWLVRQRWKKIIYGAICVLKCKSRL